LDDDGAVLLKLNNNASGVLMATQIAAGEENNVKVRVYGELGGLEWQQSDANTLQVKWLDKPTEIWRTGGGYVSSYAQHNTRTPAGPSRRLPGSICQPVPQFCRMCRGRFRGTQPKPESLDYPGIEEGVRGMAFIERVIESGKSDQKWIDFTI
jgi:predicted dehydrogenase